MEIDILYYWFVCDFIYIVFDRLVTGFSSRVYYTAQI